MKTKVLCKLKSLFGKDSDKLQAPNTLHTRTSVGIISTRGFQQHQNFMLHSSLPPQQKRYAM